MITAKTRVGAVLGWPVEHSRSPAMHNAAFAAAGIDAVFVALAVPARRVVEVVRGLGAAGVLGASVTVPLKEAVRAACDRLDPSAERTGAVNCLVFDGGEVIGHNTDAGGYVDAIVEADVEVRGARAVILGAGGAARAVHAGLTDAGATVEVIARRPSAANWTTARPWDRDTLTEAFARATLLVDCTSIALDPAAEADVVAELPLDALPPDAAVSSLVYHRTPLLLARAGGRRTVDGKGMLVHQGARAFTLWLGVPAPVDVMRAALS